MFFQFPSITVMLQDPATAATSIGSRTTSFKPCKRELHLTPPPPSAFSEDVGVHRSQQSRGAVLVGQRERGVLRCRSDLGCATVDSRILCWFVLGLYLGAFSPPLRRGKGDDQIHGCRLLESDILRCTCGQ